ncbi:MAG: NAD(P)-dependent oxidoreductase [Verrucomicrobia bacterium]|nr:NAD(P)-dependent oxidoreductase [Verrucomicrobiota bacterium]
MAWITGAAGFIGNYLVQTAPRLAPSWQIRGLTRPQLDLLDFDAVRRAFHAQRPQLVIHCAAVSRSPDAQANPELAWRINRDGTAHLARLAADIPFVFFSSDLVFDGLTGNYDESAKPDPSGVYAQTKVAAENFVLANPRHTVLRVALNAGASLTGDRAFNEQMRLAWQRGETLRLFTDEFRCPIPAVVTTRVVWELVNHDQTGVFHVAGSERLSRHEIGKLLAARWPQLHPRFAAASARDCPNPPRPRDASLNCAKVQRILPFQLPAFSQWLRDHPDELI